MNKDITKKLIPHKSPTIGKAYAKLIHLVPKPLREHIEAIIFPKPKGNVFSEIFSLGNNCYASTLMRELQIRKSSGPFDWISGPNFFGRLNLISKQFNGFLDASNLEYTNIKTPGENKIHVHNTREKFIFVHDFSSQSITEYNSVFQKYKRRQDRFLKKMRENEPNCLLYVQHQNDPINTKMNIDDILSIALKTRDAITTKDITLILCLQSNNTSKHVEIYKGKGCTVFIQRFNKNLIKKNKPILDCIIREAIYIAEQQTLLSKQMFT